MQNDSEKYIQENHGSGVRLYTEMCWSTLDEVSMRESLYLDS